MPEEDEVMEFKKLTFANDVILGDSECGFYEDTLWCYISGRPLLEVVQLFSKPENFNKVIFEFGTSSLFRRITYTGFVKLKSIEIAANTINVCIVGLDVKVEKEDVYSEGGE